MGKTMKFKSKTGYKKWLAHGHIHGDFKRSPGNTRIKIGGRAHRVKHKR